MSISAKTQARLKRDNPRTLTKKAYGELRDDLDEYGDLSGVVYNIRTGGTIAGNMRSTVFNIAECTFEITHTNEKPDKQGTVRQGFVIWRGNRFAYREVDWDKRKEDAACIRANINAGTWDGDALAAFDNEILQIARMDSDLLKKLENEERILRAMLEAANEQAGEADAEPDIDRAAELNERWQVRSGDLWEIGPHRLLCGDSTRREDVERVMGGEKAEFCFTDPPYGVKYTGGTKKWAMLENDDEVNMYAASLPFIREFTTDKAALYCAFADAKAHSVYQSFFENDYEQRALIIWNKNHAQFGAMGSQYKQKHEPIAYLFKKGFSPHWFGPNNEVTVWDIDRESVNEYHPTQKPPALYMRAMRNSAPDGCVVYEPFGGSGTSIVACQNLSRQCRAIEISPNYCAVILDRMSSAFPGLAIHRVDA